MKTLPELPSENHFYIINRGETGCNRGCCPGWESTESDLSKEEAEKIINNVSEDEFCVVWIGQDVEIKEDKK